MELLSHNSLHVVEETVRFWVPSPPVEQASSLLAAKMAAPPEG
jgi:hypothetical protein